MTPAVGGAGVEVFAQGPRPSRSARSADWSLRSGNIAVPVRCSCSSPRRGRRPAASVDFVERRRPRRAPGRQRRPAAAGAGTGSARSSTAMPSALEPKSALQRVADRLRLAARHVEAAAGEVVGLVRGERQREGDDRRSRRPETQRRRRPRNPASLIMKSRIGWAASLSQSKAVVCEDAHSGAKVGHVRLSRRPCLLADQQVARRGRAGGERAAVVALGSESACRAKPSPTAKR